MSIVLTPEGFKALGAYAPLPEGRALLAHWVSDLGNGGASRILSALAAAHPASLTKEALGGKAKLSDNSGSFSTYLSRLRRLELIEGPASAIRISQELVG